MAFSKIIALTALIGLVAATNNNERSDIDCAMIGGFCTPREYCAQAILPPMASCDMPSDVCCGKSRSVEEFVPKRCANGAGECITDCPNVIRQPSYQHECPVGTFCCVWL